MRHGTAGSALGGLIIILIILAVFYHHVFIALVHLIFGH